MIRRCSAVLAMCLPLGLAMAAASAAQNDYDVVPNLSHPGPAMKIAISPDGRLAASIEDTVRIWDMRSTRLLASVAVDDMLEEVIAFAGNETLIFATSKGEIDIYDLGAKEITGAFQAHDGAIDSIDVTEDGHFILSTNWQEAPKVWDAQTGELILELGIERGGPSVFFDADRKIAVRTEQSEIAVFDRESGRELRRFSIGTDLPDFAISPDGTSLVAWDNGELSHWDMASGTMTRSLTAPAYIETRDLAWLPDGKRVITGGHGATKTAPAAGAMIWDIETGTVAVTLSEDLGQLSAFALTNDGKRMLAASDDGPALFDWDIATSADIRRFGQDIPRVKGLSFLADGELLTVSSDRQVRVWNHGAQLERGFAIELSPSAHALSADERLLLVAGIGKEHTAELVEIASGRILQKFAPTDLAGFTMASDAAFSPDGSVIYVAYTDGVVRSWSVTTAAPGTSFEDKTAPEGRAARRVTAMAISPDGTLIAIGMDKGSASDRDAVELWNIADAKLLRRFETPIGGADDLAFHQGGRQLVAATGWRDLRIWNVDTGNVQRNFDRLGSAPVILAAAQSDTRMFVGLIRGEIVEISTVTGKVAETFEGHTASIETLDFHPESGLLASASADGTIRLWDVRNGDELATIMPGRAGWLSLTPQGFFAASGETADLLSIVHDLSPNAVDRFAKALLRPDLVREWIAGDSRRLVERAAEKLDLGKILQSGTPPDIRILSVQEDGAAVALSVGLKDTGGGIGEIEWRVNGIAQNGRSAAPLVGGQKDETVVTRRLDLLAGTNRVSVSVYTANGLLRSDPVELTLENKAAVASGNGRLYVLAIGVDEYANDALQLNYAVHDARSFSQALGEAGKPVFDDVIVETVTDAQASEAGIAAAFAKLSEAMNPNDKFVLFVAGHGFTLEGVYYFVPVDFGEKAGADSIDGIRQERWEQWIASLPAQASVLVFDTCESGTLVGTTRDVSLEETAAFDRLNYATGRSIISASTGLQAAAEGFKGHGLLTWVMLDALRKGDRNNDGFIDVGELASYAEDVVPRLSLEAFRVRQQPRKLITADFPLARVVP